MIEEMHRTLMFLGWKKDWWKKRPMFQNEDGQVLNGHTAYVEKQISVLDHLSEEFTERWGVLMDKNRIRPPWVE